MNEASFLKISENYLYIAILKIFLDIKLSLLLHLKINMNILCYAKKLGILNILNLKLYDS